MLTDWLFVSIVSLFRNHSVFADMRLIIVKTCLSEYNVLDLLIEYILTFVQISLSIVDILEPSLDYLSTFEFFNHLCV